MTEYQPLYRWQKTWPDEGDRASWETDFSGWDGDICVGRIRFETNGKMKDKWQWSGGGPHHGLKNGRILPQQGYVDTPREASRLVEEYYHRLMAHNDMKPGKA